MGLDQYVFRTKQDIPKIGHDRPADCSMEDRTKYTDATGKIDWDKYDKLRKKFEVCYWRKHPNLQGWFQALWRNNGGKPASDFFGDNFNGGDWVRIDEADLDALEACIKGGALPHTTGFFFGNSYDTPEDRKYDLKFITKARRQLKSGYKLLYTSSW